MNQMDRYGIRMSYYAKSGKLSNAVAISCRVPWWIQPISYYQQLAPSMDLVRRAPYTYEEYYNTVLKDLDPQQVANDLRCKVLCCWEKNPKHCHRRMVAWWLKETLGIEVPEVGKEA